jgi:hypothetical protein
MPSRKDGDSLQMHILKWYFKKPPVLDILNVAILISFHFLNGSPCFLLDDFYFNWTIKLQNET